MKNNTTEVYKKRLEEAVDSLTEENQRCFLGVVKALAFAQAEQDTGKKEGKSMVCPVYSIGVKC
jgi:hypothetical protein